MFRLEFDVTGRPRTQGSHFAQVTRGKGGARRLRTAPVQEDELNHWRGLIRTAATLALRDANTFELGQRMDEIGGDGIGYPRAWRGPVLVLARFRLVRPRRLADTMDDEPATVTPDGDKLERALWDALTGLAWRDDRQVIGWSGLKVYASPWESPGVSCTVLALEDPWAYTGGPAGLLAAEMRRWMG